MNWMQAYEVFACIALAVCAVGFNLSMRDLPKITRITVALLGVSALVRCAALIAKYAEVMTIGKPLVAAADGNIPMLAAIALASIVVQKVMARKNRAGTLES